MSRAEQSLGTKLTNKAVDVDNPIEIRTGMDIEIDIQSVNPVFQEISNYDDRYWVLRWNKLQHFDDDLEEIERIFDLIADRMGFGYKDIPAAHEAEVDIYEKHEGSLLRIGRYRGSDIRDAKGALNSGFSLEELLEKNYSLHEGPKIVQAVDPYRERVYRFETQPGENLVLAGIEGHSQFSENDIHAALGLPFDGDLYSRLRSETAEYDDWRE